MAEPGVSVTVGRLLGLLSKLHSGTATAAERKEIGTLHDSVCDSMRVPPRPAPEGAAQKRQEK
jgi:hypothetical protein